MRATIESLLCLPDREFKMMIKKISSGNPPKKFKSVNKLTQAIKILDEEYLGYTECKHLKTVGADNQWDLSKATTIDDSFAKAELI